ncbi:DNA excision repair protein ERCC-5 isoform X2 [Nerophis ophidion]|nr:DNA excision repair protein ERCC-5 isoform X2 [Nerophis ophidion]
MKHELLKDMKEFSKRRRTLYHKPPELSADFSQYQLAGLLHRNKLNQRLEGVEKEMNQSSAGSTAQLYGEDQEGLDVESRRLVSEDNSHYILIKGSNKTKNPPESQPATAAWTGNSAFQKRAVGRPEPLWQPLSAEEDKKQVSSSEDCKPSVSKQASPPSPRTLKAIQAAMSDDSDVERNVEQERTDGGISPRTMLAIQQALAEEEEEAKHGTLSSNSTAKSQIVISSSEEEEEAKHGTLSSNSTAKSQIVISSSDEEKEAIREKCDLTKSPAAKTVPGDLLGVSSEDMDQVIGKRNKAFHFAADIWESNAECYGGVKNEVLKAKPQDVRTGSPSPTKKVDEKGDSAQGLTFEKEHQVHPEAGVSVDLRDKPEQRTNESIGEEESESEDSFYEVSEEDHEEEVLEDQTTQGAGSPSKAAGSPAESLKSEDEEDDKMHTEVEEELEESSLPPAVNEWDDLDVAELQSLESCLQVEQSSLREQKQQQERMANSVTGQMCLETQELLRLFGIPFLVAPMEAEAQCAALDRTDHTNGTITDDSDVWLFGGRHVYKNFFSQNKYVEHYQFSDLQNQLGLDRIKLINLAYLLGSDYTEGVPGVGYVTGMEILNEFPGPGLEPLTEFSKWWSEAQERKRLSANPGDTKVKKKLRELRLQPGFPNPAVAQAYLQPAVDQSDGSFSWGRPQLDMIKDFCQARFGWSAQRTSETLQPVIKQLNTQQTQLRIDSFFRMEQQEKQAVRSQRLRRAVTCMKRKERGEEDHLEEEEGGGTIVSPSRPRKAKTTEKKKGDWSVVRGDRDGCVVRGDRDGCVVRGDRDGCVVRGDRDGCVVRGDRDGSVVRGDRDGCVVRGDRDGSVVRGDRDGCVVRGDRDGCVVRGDRDGCVVRGDRDGCVVRGDRDGCVVRGDRDGCVVRGDRDGCVVRGDRDGCVVRGDRDGCVVSGDRDGCVVSGGFLSSAGSGETGMVSQSAVSCSSQDRSEVTKIVPQKTSRRSHSSSGEDSEDDNYARVAMVTARSVFKANVRGRGTKSKRGRGRGKKN